MAIPTSLLHGNINMSKLKIWDINWVETDNHVHGDCCFGNVLIDKKTNIAHIFGVTGTKKWYPSVAKELMNRINDYHKARVKYVVGAWLKEYKD